METRVSRGKVTSLNLRCAGYGVAMARGRDIWFYLDPATLERVRAGAHNFLGLTVSALQSRGHTVHLRDDSDIERAQSLNRTGYALFHMQPATTSRGLTFRLAYVFPFWKIERSDKRWEWDVASETYDVSAIDREAALDFLYRTRKRLFGDVGSTGQDHVLIALQGQLLRHRSFQSMSPIEMIEDVLSLAGQRQILISRHPKERYSTDEAAELKRIATADARVRLNTGASAAELANASAVVSQTSSVAFQGLFFGAQPVLYGKTDFHHVAAGPASIQARNADELEFAPFLYWYLQKRALNAGRPDAQKKIVDRLIELGWEI